MRFAITVAKLFVTRSNPLGDAIHPREGFKFAFDNGAAFICVAMFDFQVRENTIIARDVVSLAEGRRRPWRA